jgi:hypothetical protein
MSAGLLAGVSGHGATTRELLSSISQPVRDLGAQILRDTFVPPPRTNWDWLMAQLKPGMKESAVAGLLSSAGATDEPDGSIANEIIKNYRVDDLWVVRCWFTNSVAGKSEGGLSEAKLVEEMDRVLVQPPAGFTGEWITYWVNGQIDFDSHYLNGKLDGINTLYYADGSIADVASCRDGVLDGEATAYYSSGHIENKGQYRHGAQVGHWIWYNQDGKVESEKDFGK